MCNVYEADQIGKKQKEWWLDKTTEIFFEEMKNEKTARDITAKVKKLSTSKNANLFKKSQEGNLNAIWQLAEFCTCKEVPAAVNVS